MDTTTLIAVIGTVGTIAGTLMGIVLTKGIDAWIKARRQKLDERQYEDTQAKGVYDLLIKTFESRVSFLEADRLVLIDKLEVSERAHRECVVKQEELRGDIKALEVRVERLTDHDKRNTEHAEEFKKAAIALAAKDTAAGPGPGA